MQIGRLNIKFQSPVIIEIEGDYMKEVKRALGEGRKLEAIKIYKTATGQGLKESKEFVDGLCEKYYKPDNYQEQTYNLS